jgi:membrane associated rhomboid family serine protease
MTLALALASTIVFVLFVSNDRLTLREAATFYVDSGLAAIELPRYRDYLQQRADSDAIGRLAQLERVAGASLGRPADPAATVEVLRDDRPFERDLHAGKVVTPSDPGYQDWQRNRPHFDQLIGSPLSQRLALTAQAWTQPWRLVTYLFLSRGAAAWLISLLVLLLVGPFAEAAVGPALLLLFFVGGGAIAGAVNLVFSSSPMIGDWGALAALAGLLAALFGTRPMVGRLLFVGRRIALPGPTAVLVLIGAEALRWALGSHSAIDVPADLSGLAFGAAMVGIFKLRDARRFRNLTAQVQAADHGWPKESSLSRQAREAATRLDGRKATSLYKQLVDLEPQRIEHLCAYLNVAMLGPDETTLQDAALRLLWLRARSHSDEMRKTFLLMTQPKVLKVLPIDEHLRLARRLVRMREDAAALRVLDSILTDTHLRQLYGRQLADCLLGIYTGYMRRRLTTLAETIRSRLATYFEAPDHLGGVPPSTRHSTTRFTTLPRAPHTRPPPRG